MGSGWGFTAGTLRCGAEAVLIKRTLVPSTEQAAFYNVRCSDNFCRIAGDHHENQVYFSKHIVFSFVVVVFNSSSVVENLGTLVYVCVYIYIYMIIHFCGSTDC